MNFYNQFYKIFSYILVIDCNFINNLLFIIITAFFCILKYFKSKVIYYTNNYSKTALSIESAVFYHYSSSRYVPPERTAIEWLPNL